jgi:DNA polymerase III epsilon subunit-like protein
LARDNLFVFLDTEFTNLSRNAKLISIGLVSMSHEKETFYAEFNDYSTHFCSDFTKENVINKLIFNDRNDIIQEDENYKVYLKSDTRVIRTRLLNWLGYLHETHKKQITIVVDVGAYDWMLFAELIGTNDDLSDWVPHFINYIPIDVSTMLFVAGFDPDVKRETFLGLQPEDEHNSLRDAKKTQMIYAMLMNKFFARLYEGEMNNEF